MGAEHEPVGRAAALPALGVVEPCLVNRTSPCLYLETLPSRSWRTGLINRVSTAVLALESVSQHPSRGLTETINTRFQAPPDDCACGFHLPSLMPQPV